MRCPRTVPTHLLKSVDLLTIDWGFKDSDRAMLRLKAWRPQMLYDYPQVASIKTARRYWSKLSNLIQVSQKKEAL